MVKPQSAKPLPTAAPLLPRGPTSPVRLPAERRKEAILVAALPVFAVRGYAGATTRELAAAAGVTEPILYRHFRSKADLFAAVLGRGESRILERMESAVKGADDAPARLKALAALLPEIFDEMEDEFRVVNGAAVMHADAEMAALVRETYAKLGAFLSRAVAAAGLKRGVDPRTAGHLLLEIGLGAALTRPLRVPAVTRPGFGDAAVRILLSALTDDRPSRG